MTHSPRGIGLGTGRGLDGTTPFSRATCTVTPEPTANSTILIIGLSATNAARLVMEILQDKDYVSIGLV